MVIDTKFSKIGKDQPCFIIAEIGSNHNGDFNIACELIQKAKEAGVNAVKFQTFKAKNHYSKYTPKVDLYDQDIYTLIKSLEIDRSWHTKLSDYCENINIDFLDSPCDNDAVDLALSVNMPLLKVASFDMIDLKLVEKIASTGKGIILSTGMSNLSEIQDAINICRLKRNEKIIVLQCTSLYPAPSNLANLKVMNTLSQAFNVIIGYSDHTMGDHIACAAVARGAKVIEKHYTLNRGMTGPDHAFAIEPIELTNMVYKIREIESAIGDGEKNGPRDEELEMFKLCRRSIVANRNLVKGSIITSHDICIKRPSLGIHPRFHNIILGRKVVKDIYIDEPITWEDI